MRKISGMVDKSDTDNGFSNDISSLFEKDFFRILNKDEISLLNPLSVFDLSTIPLIFLILSDLPKSPSSPYIYI